MSDDVRKAAELVLKSADVTPEWVASAIKVARAVLDKPARKPRAKPAAPRKPNPLFDVIAAVTGLDPSIRANASLIGKVAASLAKADVPYTVAEVNEFAIRFREFCTYAAQDRRPPTPNEIEKNISKVRKRRQSEAAINPFQLPEVPR